jgi:hypothetical protein
MAMLVSNNQARAATYPVRVLTEKLYGKLESAGGGLIPSPTIHSDWLMLGALALVDWGA